MCVCVCVCVCETCSPSRPCRMVRFPVFFSVKMMTLPVWLNLGAPGHVELGAPSRNQRTH